MTLRRVLYTASLCGALLALPSAMPVHASAAGAHASIASTSRMLIPPDRVKLLSASELATYGIKRVDAVALETRRAHSQFLPR
jgi:hypothetical protein